VAPLLYLEQRKVEPKELKQRKRVLISFSIFRFVVGAAEASDPRLVWEAP